MAEIRRSPRLARNTALAALAVLGTTALVTLTAVRPGADAQSCPGGEAWVVAEPAELSMIDYDAKPMESATALPAGGPSAAAAAVVLSGCVDTDRLHPAPVTGDGRG
jgi:hypothetical protein